MTFEEAKAAAEVEVWVCNLQSVNTFVGLLSQWRVAMGGATGLDYAAVEPVLRLTKVPPEEWAEVFDDLRVMEDSALAQMRINEKEKK